VTTLCVVDLVYYVPDLLFILDRFAPPLASVTRDPFQQAQKHYTFTYKILREVGGCRDMAIATVIHLSACGGGWVWEHVDVGVYASMHLCSKVRTTASTW
jgi:hypothetical protein